MERYQAHTIEERSELFYNELREGYEEWLKIKNKPFICFANFLGFKPRDVSLTTARTRIFKKNYDI